MNITINYCRTGVNIRFMGLNVCGVASKLRLGILENYIRDFDVISLCETKTDEIDEDALPDYTSFSLQKSNATHRYGGVHGISLLVKNHLASSTTILKDTTAETVLWCTIDNDSLGIYIVVGSTYST